MLAAVGFLNFLGFSIIIPVAPFLVALYVPPADLGLMVGVVIAVYSACQFIAAPALGAMSDRWGRRPVLLISLAGSVVGYLIFGIGGALWVLLLGRIIDGLTGGSISTIFAYLADVVAPEERGRAYGILGAANGAGFIVGPAIGGLAGEYALALPVFLAAGVSALTILWAWFALPESLPPERRTMRFAPGQLNPFAAFGQVYAVAPLRVAFAVAFLFGLAGAALQGNLSLFLRDILALGPGGIGAVLLLVGVMDIISQGVLAGWLLPRLGARNLARLGLGIEMLGFGLIAFIVVVPSLWLLILSVVVLVLGEGFVYPTLAGIIANAAPPNLQGSIQGANQGQQAIARILGPLLAAALYTAAAPAPYIAGALILLGAVSVLSLGLRRA